MKTIFYTPKFGLTELVADGLKTVHFSPIDVPAGFDTVQQSPDGRWVASSKTRQVPLTGYRRPPFEMGDEAVILMTYPEALRYCIEGHSQELTEHLLELVNTPSPEGNTNPLKVKPSLMPVKVRFTTSQAAIRLSQVSEEDCLAAGVQLHFAPDGDGVYYTNHYAKQTRYYDPTAALAAMVFDSYATEALDEDPYLWRYKTELISLKNRK